MQELEQYKENFPRGKNVAEANRLLQKSREEELYANARRQHDIPLYRSYLLRYSDGKYVNEVTSALREAMLNKANSEYENEQYHAERISYQSFRSKFPSSEQSEFVEFRLDQIDKIERKKARESMRTSSKYFMFTYSTAEEYGFESGGLHLNNVATYFNMRPTKMSLI